jgi:hypothetical protein
VAGVLVEFAAVERDPAASGAQLDGTGVAATGSAAGSMTTVAVGVGSHDPCLDHCQRIFADSIDAASGRGASFAELAQQPRRTHTHTPVRIMATNESAVLERMQREEERTALLSGASISSRMSLSGVRRSGVVDKCYTFTTLLCAFAFPLLGTCIVILGAIIADFSSGAHVAGGAYVGGGTAELVLGACLILRLLFHLCKLSRRSCGETTNCVLFLALTFAFLVWCGVAFSLCVAVVLNGLNYHEDWRETTAMVLSCISLVLVLVFGGSTCYWAGCPAD